MTIDNLIFINGGEYANIKKVLQQWMTVYSDDLPDGLIFKLYKNGRGKHIIKADERLDNWSFYFLINYLNYPEGIEHTIEIEGFTAGKDNDVLKDKKLLVYISSDDKDGDNVYVTTSENNNYKVDFGGEITEASETKTYRLPDTKHLENPEIFEIKKDEISKEQEVESIKSSQKRFNIIAIIVFIALMLNLLIPNFLNVTKLFEDTTAVIFISIGAWFLVDNEMLKSNSLFMKCILLAFGCLIYQYLIIYFQQGILKPGLTTSYFPLSLLIVQWPARRIYKAIFKREPEVVRTGKIADVTYTWLLAAGWLTLSFGLMTTFTFK